MSIYPQPNSWLCGPFALKHALVVFGMFENEWTIARAAGSDTRGTDERDLARAARQFDCSVRMVRVHYPEDAREELVHHLAQGLPILLCVEQWDHWVTAMHHDDGRFVLFDSRGPHVIRIMSWEELEPKWRYRDQSGSSIFDLHPVVARSMDTRPRATFSLDRAKWLASSQNAGLARQWSDYGSLLLTHGRSRRSDHNHDLFTISMCSAFQVKRADLATSLERTVGLDVGDEVYRVLERLEFVAATYDLAVDTGGMENLWADVEQFVIARLRIARPTE